MKAMCVRNMQAILVHPLVFHAQFLIHCSCLINGFTDRCIKKLLTILSYYHKTFEFEGWSLV